MVVVDVVVDSLGVVSGAAGGGVVVLALVDSVDVVLLGAAVLVEVGVERSALHDATARTTNSAKYGPRRPTWP
jgi:hypothetical protein